MAIGLCVLMGASALVSFVVARRSTGGATGPFAILAVSTLAIAAFSRVAGPFIVAPSLAVANTVGFAMFPDRKLRALMVALGSSAIVAPALLEWAGVLPPSYAFRDGTLVVLPQVHGFPPVPTMATLLVTAVAIVVTSSIFVSRIRDALDDAEERLYAYAWSLRQLVPDEARHAAQAPTVAPPTDYVACLVESLVDQHGPELRARLAARIGRG
jgi:serine/threonine-protein kinase